MQNGTSRCSNSTLSRALWAGGCTVLLKNEEVARNCTDTGQHLLFQQHVPDILSIYFDARVREYEVGRNSLVSVSKNNRICIYFACKITKLAILILQGSAATQSRCGGQYNKYFVANLLPNSTVKKFWKSVNICQSYRQKYRGPYDSQCSVYSKQN